MRVYHYPRGPAAKGSIHHDFNESAIRTSICAAITSNMRMTDAPGNVRVTRRASGLPQESVVNVSQL
jgi:mRNA interferase MazF